jgi:hypothetical protein
VFISYGFFLFCFDAGLVLGLVLDRFSMKKIIVAMSRFAFDCMLQVLRLTKQLESTLGPDTGDLSTRMGLHSGPGMFI